MDLFAAFGMTRTPAFCVMVLGTSSGAGKSFLTTALCRHLANLGYKVAPFKAQNMSNNARVVATPSGDAGEMGSAQYFQALAAKAVPEVAMNPVLLKPESDTHSQVVVMGQVNKALAQVPWRERSGHVWPIICQALDELRAKVDCVVIEGAGSPAEINLAASDIVNMRVAQYTNAHCLLVTDIDKGGAFAHLYGTWALLPPEQRALIKGFVLNKFRGDAALLAPGPAMLQDLTGVPVVATLPMWREHGLPEEDGLFNEGYWPASGRAPERNLTLVAIVAWPRISNLDEFQVLRNLEHTRLVWARTPADLHNADWVILPGSKHTTSDLQWLRSTGMDAAITRHAQHGGTVLGICGGLQVLGEALIDPHGIDGNAPGLGLLPLVTQFEVHKTVKPTHGRFQHLQGVFQDLNDLPLQGYEIHHGSTYPHQGMAAAGNHAIVALTDQEGQAIGWRNPEGNVLGIYLHGLFENDAVVKALFGAQSATLDAVFDGLARYIQTHFIPQALDALAPPASPTP